MAKYDEGDIVLLSGAKLGIITSTNTVKEVVGDRILCNDLNDKQIVKKLSAKDLAESLIDLMARYSNLQQRKVSNSTSLQNNDNIHLIAPRPQHQYKVSATDTTQNTTTNTTTTTTTSGTNTTRNNTKSKSTGTNTGTTHKSTTTTTTTTTTSSSEPKPTTFNTETDSKTDLEIPNTPNRGNHAFSPTDSNYVINHYFYGPYPTQKTTIMVNPKRDRISTTSETNDDSNHSLTQTATSTISSLSPELKARYTPNTNSNTNTNTNTNTKAKKRRALLHRPKIGKSKKSRDRAQNKNTPKYSDAPTLTTTARKGPGSGHDTRHHRKLRSRFPSPFHRRKKNKVPKKQDILSNSPALSQSHSQLLDRRIPEPQHLDITYNQSFESDSHPLPAPGPVPVPVPYPQHHQFQPHHHHHSTPYTSHNEYYNDPYYLYPAPHHHPIGTYPPTAYHTVSVSHSGSGAQSTYHNHIYREYAGLRAIETGIGPYRSEREYEDKLPLPFSHVRSNPEDHYEPPHDNTDGNTLLPPSGHERYGKAEKTRILRSKSTGTPPRYTPSTQSNMSHNIHHQNIHTSNTFDNDKYVCVIFKESLTKIICNLYIFCCNLRLHNSIFHIFFANHS